MTPAQREKLTEWIATLESGKYVQGETFLKANGKHCCLGVLCEMNGLEEVQPPSPRSAGAVSNFILPDGDRKEAVLPVSYVFENTGVRNVSMLYDLNDVEGDGKYTAVIAYLKEFL